MSNDKPMRHEEYLAMAEQNRRLLAENSKLKAKQDRKMKSIRTKLSRIKEMISLYNLIRAAGILCVLFLFVVFPLLAWRADSLDQEEKNRPAACYILAQPKDAADPWSPWRLWRVKNSRHNKQWIELVDGINAIFSTRDAGIEFAKAYNITLCK